MPFQSWNPCFVPCSWARVGEAVSWTCAWCSQGRPRHLAMNPAMGWKGSADALFSFETRSSSEAHCLQAAWNVSSSYFAPAPSCLPRQGVSHACPCSSFESSEGHCPYLLRQGVFTVICATPGLTAAQDLPSRAGQKADFMSHEKMSRFKCCYCKGEKKGQIDYFLLKWCPGEICSALILLSFLFSLFCFSIK